MGCDLESLCLGRVYGAGFAARQHPDDGRVYPKHVELRIH